MTKLTFITITSLSVMLAGCQKAKMSSAQQPSASAQSPSPGYNNPPPVNNPPPPAGYPPLPPRFPEDEPREVVVNPPPMGPPPIIQPPRIPEPDPRDPTTTPPPVRPSPPVTTTTPPPVATTPPVLTPVDTTPTVRPPVTNPPRTNPPVTNPPPTTTRPPVTPPTTTTVQPPPSNPPTTTPRPPVTPPPTTTTQTPPTQPPTTIGRPPVVPPSTTTQPGVPPPGTEIPYPTARPNANPPPVVQTQVPQPVPSRPGFSVPGDRPQVIPPATPVTTFKQPARPITPTPKQFLTKDTPSNIPTPTPAPEDRPTVKLPDNPPIPPSRPIEYASIEGQCTIEPVTMAQKNQLDVLFVVDTSGSLRKGPNDSPEGGELVKMAGEMDAFVQKLPAGTDINIGVVLAHGPKSPHYGRLFAPGDWPILKNSEIKGSKIYSVLKEKLKKVPDDSWDPHQGEAIMMNIFAAIASEKRLADFRAQGLFRKGANLAVIIVTDENDVCYQYPKALSEYTSVDEALFREGKAPVLKSYPQGKRGSVTSADRLEIEAQKLCTITGKDKTSSKYIDWQAAAEKLRSLEATLGGGKVIASGIVYKDNMGKQMKPFTDNEDENEMGHGVIELVESFSGQLADMAEVRKSGSFAGALDLIGNTTNFMSKHDVSYICQPGLVDGKRLNGAAIDYSTVELEVIQTQQADIDSFNPQRPTMTAYGQKLARYSAKCPSKGACQDADGGLKIEKFADGKTIRVTPADVAGYQKRMNSYGGQPAKYRITYRTKKDVNPFLEGDAPAVESGYKAPAKPATAAGQQPSAQQPSGPEDKGFSIPGDRPQTMPGARPAAASPTGTRQVVRPGQHVSGPEAVANRAKPATPPNVPASVQPAAKDGAAKRVQPEAPTEKSKPKLQPLKPGQNVQQRAPTPAAEMDAQPATKNANTKPGIPVVTSDQLAPATEPAADVKPAKPVKPAAEKPAAKKPAPKPKKKVS